MNGVNIISKADLNTFRKFPLTSGYNNQNTKFVRVKDGYAVGADPLLINDYKNGGKRKHHIKCSGYLYGLYKGYVMATEKEGMQGWTDLIEQDQNTYLCFNPFGGKPRRLKIKLIDDYIIIDDGTEKEFKEIGTYATLFGDKKISAKPFTGIKFFIRLMTQISAKEYPYEIKGHSFNKDLTKKIKYKSNKIIFLEGNKNLMGIWQEHNPKTQIPEKKENNKIIEEVYLDNFKTPEYISISSKYWCANYVKNENEIKIYEKMDLKREYNDILRDAFNLELFTPPKGLDEKCRRIAEEQFHLDRTKRNYSNQSRRGRKKHKKDYYPVYSIRKLLYLYYKTGIRLYYNHDELTYKGKTYKLGQRFISDMTFSQCVEYFKKHLLKKETKIKFREFIMTEGWRREYKYQFLYYKESFGEKIYKSHVGSSEYRMITEKEKKGGVWRVTTNDKSFLVEKEEALRLKNEVNKAQIDRVMESFTNYLGEIYKIEDFKTFHQNKGSLEEFATINGLRDKADECMRGSGEEAPIFWNANSHPVWYIEDDYLYLSGILNTNRNHYKVGTYFYYNYPAFIVRFDKELNATKIK